MQRLSDHFAAGRLSVAEFDERSGLVSAAVTRADLAPVFGDLPAGVPQVAGTPEPDIPHSGGRRGIARSAVGVAVIVALVLFFVTDSWLWFLLIPVAAFVAAGLRQSAREQRQDEHEQRRDERERRRRERRRGRPGRGEH